MRRFLALALLCAGCSEKTDAAPTATVSGSTAASTAAASSPVSKGETTYYFGASDNRTNISFDAKTGIMVMQGGTRKVRGSAVIDPDAGTGRTHLIVPAESLATGDADRDRAMRTRTWLDVNKYPTLEFKAEKAAFTKPSTWKIDGKFTLHGVTKDLSLTAEVKMFPPEAAKKLGPGNWIRVKTEFALKLSDFEIKIPSQSIAQVDDVWNVHIDLFGTTEKPADALDVPKTGDEEEDTPVIRPKEVVLENAEGARFVFGKKKQLTNISATSETDLETVTASTTTSGGILAVDLEKGVGKVKLTVPVLTLKTGIDKRDEHLCSETWLDAKKFPDIFFESTRATRKDGKTWLVEGNFTIHGQTKPVTIEVAMREIPAEKAKQARWGDKPALGFNTMLTLKLSDFGVKIPEIAVAKVKDEWTLKIDLVALSE